MDSWLSGLIEQTGYIGVAFLMFAETVFPPIPSEVIMSMAGFQASQGTLSLGGIIAAGTAGAMFGNLFWYLLARAFGYQRFRAFTERHGRWLTIEPDEVDRAQSWFDRWGHAAVGIGRIIPTARSLISVPAGILKMSFTRFAFYSTIGTLAWTAELRGRVDVVVANAPYVPTAALALMPAEARDHEPAVALDGGPDGLDVQ